MCSLGDVERGRVNVVRVKD
ncbi:hypothetical protein A2U01_0102942, partial [Trifolium medium]|nr:hypothetical protein [Trifolium medium]